MTILDIPNITDWISSIAAAIGVPLVLWSFIKLVIRDKDREKEITALTNISKAQSDSFEEMKKMLLETQKQTQEFAYQTKHMQELNDIFKEYLETVSMSISQNKDYQQNLLDLENKKRKTEIKPHFIFAGAMGQGYSGSYEIRLKNIGKTAYLKDLTIPEECPIDFYKNFEENKMVKPNDEIAIAGQIKEVQQSVNMVGFEFELVFEDTENNKYKQKVIRFNGGSSYKIGNPEDVQE